MPVKTQHVRESRQANSLSAGLRDIAETLAVPASVPKDDGREDRDAVDPDDVGDSITQVRLTA